MTLQTRRQLGRGITGLLAGITLVASIGLTGSALAADGPNPNHPDKDWGVEVVAYLWLSSLDGEMGFPATGTMPISATFRSLASNLDAGFAGFLDARYKRVHLFSDNSWVKLKMTAVPDNPLVDGADLTASTAFGTVGFAYDIPFDTDVTIAVYLAARWWRSDTDIDFDPVVGPGFSGTYNETWADAVVGLRASYWISEKWRVRFTADVGAGAADLDWQVLGNVTYMFTDWLGASAAYRILGVDYRKNGFVYDIRQHGLQLGFNFLF